MHIRHRTRETVFLTIASGVVMFLIVVYLISVGR